MSTSIGEHHARRRKDESKCPSIPKFPRKAGANPRWIFHIQQIAHTTAQGKISRKKMDFASFLTPVSDRLNVKRQLIRYEPSPGYDIDLSMANTRMQSRRTITDTTRERTLEKGGTEGKN